LPLENKVKVFGEEDNGELEDNGKDSKMVKKEGET
jgi:hypothetical protein